MPKKIKIKSSRAAAKRFKRTGKGLFVFSRSGVRHLNTGSSRKQLRQLKGTAISHKSDFNRLRRLLPNM